MTTTRPTSPAAKRIRRRQLLVLGLLLAGIGALAAGVRFLSQENAGPATRGQAAPVNVVASPAVSVDPAKGWRAAEGGRLDKLAQDMADLRMRLEQRDRDEDLRREARDREAAKEKEARDKAPPPGRQEEKTSGGKAMPPLPPPPEPGRTSLFPPGVPGNTGLPGSGAPQGILAVDFDAATSSASDSARGTPAGPSAATAKGTTARLLAVDDAGAPPDPGLTMPLPPAATDAAPFPAGYLPTSSFVAAENLNGVLAPTSGAAQASPAPMVFRLTNHAQLPNLTRAPVKDCFVQGAAHGELGAEIVHVRLLRLSCVLSSGRSVDMPVYGYVVGENGVEGLSGRVVTKQGQALANALLAGVASGVGRGLAQSATTTANSAVGSVQQTKDGQQLQYGIAQGVGTALDRLSKYYLDLADQMHPVIEILALRHVTLVFAKGFDNTGATSASSRSR
ncbi:MAG: TraB/VirB10 family protein [Rhodocyclaceae bacterium]|nr:TraB/VirB10 family protein [Rhodocyclaceae bacterium]MBX3669849.1 TraB/VirB10 family protein [Rhodocyclaceae bacterium]